MTTEFPVLVTALPARMAKGVAVPSPTVGWAAKAPRDQMVALTTAIAAATDPTIKAMPRRRLIKGEP
jgi:hypothetical protein